MAKKITFRMAAWSDAAGKYDPDAPLNGNEDNFFVDDDLSDDVSSQFGADEQKSLSDCGLLMAVADGMGGMNAGEVASQIAHDTVAEYFAPGKITPKLAATHESRSRYMEDVVREADRRIKDEARNNSEHDGMGSTLIMAWIAGGELSLTWIGDSRAYRFNPATGIEPLSRDHSYVQELADKGVITYEQTFEHPQGNIITRSLGDTSKKAKPESRKFTVSDGDIILLCSDGLSGVLRDRQTTDEDGNLLPGENIEDIIRNNSSSLSGCREALWAAAERADWYDNVTTILCEICSGAGAYDPSHAKADRVVNGSIATKKARGKKALIASLLVLFVAACAGALWYTLRPQPQATQHPAPPPAEEQSAITEEASEVVSEPPVIEEEQSVKVENIKIQLPQKHGEKVKPDTTDTTQNTERDNLTPISEVNDTLTSAGNVINKQQ